MDEAIIDDMATALFHLYEVSTPDWNEEADAAFLIQCLYEFGYELKVRTDIPIN